MAEPKAVATRAVGPLRRIVADLGPFRVVDASGSDRGWRLRFGVEAASADGGALPGGSTSVRLPPCRAADYLNSAVPPVVRPGYAPVDEGTLQVASARPGTGGGSWTCGTERDGGRLEIVIPAASGRAEVTLTTTLSVGP
jgi:hypothetical protein